MQPSKRVFMNQLGSAVVLAGMTMVPALAQDKAKAGAKDMAKSGNYQRKVLVDNAKVVVTEVTTKPGGESDSRVRDYYRVARALSGGTQERTWADGKKEKIEWKTGEVRFSEPDKMAYKAKNIGKTDLALYIVRLK